MLRVVAFLLSLALALAAIVGGLIAVAGNDATSCMATATGPVDELDVEQSASARVIVAVGQQLGIPTRGLLVALMTARQESGLRNLDYGDRDSLGLFQQRPSMGWGTPEQVRDPAYAAAAFYGGPASPTPNRGLMDVPAWETMQLNDAAQAVQRSGFPDAYARWEVPARQWLSAIASDSAAGGGCPEVSPSSAVAITAAMRWLGAPYAWGGGSLDGPSLGFGSGAGTVGFDCSGLTRYAWAQAGVLLPRVSRDQWNAPGVRVTAMAQIQAGDLLFFASDLHDPSTIFHVALSLGGDAMVEAPQTGDVVKIVEALSSNPYWAPKFIGGLRLAASS
ncbi:C40 family peptidase [Cellulomonas humilata]|uniref:Cell wall-associated NlpC family hydrolase n=1 Tax=Cellulomonas humilata TaxID=144055 RepID=A0ABU0ELR4_9CELL|nr:NlpC/P60 family protein [Cellulomonas humilata]MDQ0375955.1 cell wall-associated NlpC family hydrolase [Cellulomonas humilata]